jgi:hypothetical protein
VYENADGSAPAVSGCIYFNSNDKKFYKCTNGFDWVDMLSSARIVRKKLAEYE